MSPSRFQSDLFLLVTARNYSVIHLYNIIARRVIADRQADNHARHVYRINALPSAIAGPFDPVFSGIRLSDARQNTRNFR